ncbi:LysR substrate-binding domain-containing protein [Actinomycetospora sp. TBRC 11914]|uniref:LysR substrate-binding domain-containing protein n=1 Tax=Actinomycetospora sp. TBRC 11914 TaxID=2729387 RepID=UPI00145D5FC3|nr:LysR substrate-binding domain-containing protein [Actinomycetospora sp. TBRC 11914]NMO91503.1 LysR family transcriptional regulator [Actinomycetospora sp. TBRC 11914]
MRDTFNLEHLRTVVAIADLGGFGRAATALHLSQSAVSKHVRLLEMAVGGVLLEKHGRGARFTATGELVLDEARRLLALNDEAMGRLAVRATTPLTVGMAEHVADRTLTDLLGALRAGFAPRTVRFRMDRSPRLVDSVGRGETDLAFVVAANAEAVGRDLGTLALHWYAGRRAEPSDPAAPFPLVAFEDPCGLRDAALRALAEEGRRAEVVAESSSFSGVVEAVRAGLGVALLPTAAGVPPGLVRRGDLPDMGSVPFRLLTRPGLDARLEETALEVAGGFASVLTPPFALPRPAAARAS